MDFVSDNNPKPLYTAVPALGDLPEYVTKQAAFEPSDVVDLTSDAFADPACRELPIHTKSATYLSALDYHFREDTTRPLEALERIKTAATFFGIADDVTKVADAALQYFAAPATEVAYAVGPEGAKIAGLVDAPGIYPIGNIATMLDSADIATRDYEAGRLPMGQFREASVNFCKLASACGTMEDLPYKIRCMGEDRLPDFDTAMSVANTRKLAGVDAEARDIYVDMVKAAEVEYNESGRDEAVIQRWIGAWIELDQGQGVKYSHLVPNPYEAFFSGPDVDEVEKMASTHVVVGNVMVPAVEFASVPESVMTSRFAPATAEGLILTQKTAAYDAPEASRQVELLDDDIQRRLLRVLAAS